jgi:homoserine kinase
VPATSANLGPGFDCLGLALNIYLRVTCATGGVPALQIEANESGIELDERNLVYRAMQLVFAATGRPLPGLELRIDNAIPLSRGLGSSAAAITAGLALANAILGEPFDRRRLLSIGLPLEGGDPKHGHPDNLAPALFGGLRVSSVADGEVLSVPLTMARPPRIALFVPEFVMTPASARRVLPEAVPRADAVFNTTRSSLLVAALAAGEFGVLRWAMEDRLHQPYRSALFPALHGLIEAALQAGAAGAALSGAGSTVIALCEGDPAPVVHGLERAAHGLGVSGQGRAAEIDPHGAELI